MGHPGYPAAVQLGVTERGPLTTGVVNRRPLPPLSGLRVLLWSSIATGHLAPKPCWLLTSPGPSRLVPRHGSSLTRWQGQLSCPYCSCHGYLVTVTAIVLLLEDSTVFYQFGPGCHSSLGNCPLGWLVLSASEGSEAAAGSRST